MARRRVGALSEERNFTHSSVAAGGSGWSKQKPKESMEERRKDEREKARTEMACPGGAHLIDLNEEPTEAVETQWAPVPPPETEKTVGELPLLLKTIPPSETKESERKLRSSFSKTLTAAYVGQNAGACLEFPEDYWKMHKHKILSVVSLKGIHQQSPVRAMTLLTSLRQASRSHLKDECRASSLKTVSAKGNSS